VEVEQMLLVPNYLARSPIHGIGVFAAKFIKRGTVVWVYDEGIDHYITVQTFEALPLRAQEFLHTYACRFSSEQFCIYGDNVRFINHARPGNIGYAIGIDGEYIALRDIQVGDELVTDYALICIDFIDGQL
jgi:hypothetical protein